MASPEGFDLYQRLRPRRTVENSDQESLNQAENPQSPIYFVDIPGSSWLEIHSELLRTKFRYAARRDQNGIDLDQDPIIIDEPYRELYYCRDEIFKILEDDNLEDNARRELQLLVDFQEEHMADTIRKIDEFKENGTIDFEHLWALFLPQELFVLPIYGIDDGPLLSCVRLCRSLNEGEKRIWDIRMERTGFDGVRFGCVTMDFYYDYFPGIKKITDLSVYPLRFCQDQDLFKRTTIERGKKYEKYCIRSAGSRPATDALMTYDGPLWTPQHTRYINSQGFAITKSPIRIRGQVAVNDNGMFPPHPESRDSILPSFPQTISGLSEDQLLLCPPYVSAFSLSAYEAGAILVDRLGDTIWNLDALLHLRIDESTKTVLSRLFENHPPHDTSLEVAVYEQGHGLVILLHGPSGSGKAQTAESISQVLRKPLLRLNQGTIRDWEGGLRQRLKKLSLWAERRRAIILVDEVDRAFEDHAIVSAFLDMLDEHHGIVFMTAERIDRFYKAIYARIHVTLEYPPLGRQFREAIWTNLALTHGCTLTAEQASKLAKPATDERKIKNVLYLASLMARRRGIGAKMQFSDIQDMVLLGIGEQGGGAKIDEV